MSEKPRLRRLYDQEQTSTGIVPVPMIRRKLVVGSYTSDPEAKMSILPAVRQAILSAFQPAAASLHRLAARHPAAFTDMIQGRTGALMSRTKYTTTTDIRHSPGTRALLCGRSITQAAAFSTHFWPAFRWTPPASMPPSTVIRICGDTLIENDRKLCAPPTQTDGAAHSNRGERPCARSSCW
jgi:hypothetical protein